MHVKLNVIATFVLEIADLAVVAIFNCNHS